MIGIIAFLRTKLGQALGFLALIAGGFAIAHRKGKTEAKEEAKELDHENAADIRERVARSSERVSEFNDSGYRD